MDLLSLAGIILGVGAILAGNLLEGGHLDSLINGPALVIVLGGTLGAMLLQFPPAVFRRALRLSLWIFLPRRLNLKQHIDKIVDWSALARREGLLGLEAVIELERDSFVQKGLQLLVDGNDPEVIRASLEVELSTQERQDLLAARVYEAMGGYSPTLGIIGAVMGLIHVMQNLTDPAKLGEGIATAFVATIYGVGFANLLFLPIAQKLKTHVHNQTHLRELLADGIAAIADGENPRNIELKLSGFLHESLR